MMSLYFRKADRVKSLLFLKRGLSCGKGGVLANNNNLTPCQLAVTKKSKYKTPNIDFVAQRHCDYAERIENTLR